MGKKTHTSQTLCTVDPLVDSGLRSVKREVKRSCVESVGSNDVPVHCGVKRRREVVSTSSRSSGSQRSASSSQLEAIFVRTMENFIDWMTDERARGTGDAGKSELKLCMDAMRAMEGISTRLVVKASQRLTDYSTRQTFLQFNEVEWVVGLADQ